MPSGPRRGSRCSMKEKLILDSTSHRGLWFPPAVVEVSWSTLAKVHAKVFIRIHLNASLRITHQNNTIYKCVCT